MKRITCIALLVLVFEADAFSAPPNYTILKLSQSSFAGTSNEVFNEAIDYSNATYNPNEDYTGSMVIVGINNPYPFTNTGVVFTAPIPNINGNWLPIISVVKGNQDLNFGTYGTLMEGSGLIPGGTGARFLLETGSSSNHFPPFVLTFPGNGAVKIGGDYLVASQNLGVGSIVLTPSGYVNGVMTSFGSVSISGTNVANWANNFLGIEVFPYGKTTPIAIKSLGINYSADSGVSNPAVANLLFVGDSTTCTATGTASWANSANWTFGDKPRANVSAVFSGNATASITLDEPQTTNGIVFNNSAGSCVISAGNSGSLTLGDGVNAAQISSSNSNAISANISIPKDLVVAGGTLAISGNISGTGGLVETGNGLLVLSGTDNWAGGTQVLSGTVEIKKSCSLPNNSRLVVGGGGVFIFDPTVSCAPSQATQQIPEPGTFALLISAIIAGGIFLLRRLTPNRSQDNKNRGNLCLGSFFA